MGHVLLGSANLLVLEVLGDVLNLTIMSLYKENLPYVQNQYIVSVFIGGS